MAETAEQAEMRALKEEVARLKKTRAAVVKALEAQSWDDVRAALAHSESSKARGYSRRGMTPEEKKAHNRSMFSPWEIGVNRDLHHTRLVFFERFVERSRNLILAIQRSLLIIRSFRRETHT